MTTARDDHPELARYADDPFGSTLGPYCGRALDEIDRLRALVAAHNVTVTEPGMGPTTGRSVSVVDIVARFCLQNPDDTQVRALRAAMEALDQ